MIRLFETVLQYNTEGWNRAIEEFRDGQMEY